MSPVWKMKYDGERRIHNAKHDECERRPTDRAWAASRAELRQIGGGASRPARQSCATRTPRHPRSPALRSNAEIGEVVAGVQEHDRDEHLHHERDRGPLEREAGPLRFGAPECSV